MILDSSAIVAILCREAGYRELLEKLSAVDAIAVAAPTVFETAMVLTIKLRRDGLALANEFLRESGATVAAFTQDHTSAAFGAYMRYGNGRHGSALNFGDCVSYATAKISGQSLLFVGDDFAKTDIPAA